MATSLNVTYVPVTFKVLAGGLNTTSGPLMLDDSESSDLQNVEFNKFGSVLKRNGYEVLNTNILTGTAQGLYWYSAPSNQYAITVNNGQIWKMDDLDGTWDDISGAVKLGGSPDSYTKLLLHCDGADEGVSFIDSSAGAKTVIDTETYDSYTVLMLHADGTDGGTTFSDTSLSSKAITNTATTDAYTVLLIKFDGVDGSKANYTAETGQTVSMGTTLGNDAQLDTAQKEFGSASLLLDGTGDYVSVPDSTDWFFDANDFTIDLWIRFNSVASSQTIICQYPDGSHYWFIDYISTGFLFFAARNGAPAVDDIQVMKSWTPVVNTWYHIAVVRDSNVFTLYIDGTSIGSETDDSPIANLVANLIIGRRDFLGDQNFNGWIDEVRISKSIARWSTNFTRPSYPYGQAVISTTNKKFGTASAYFDGSGSLLTCADSADWDLGNTWTVDGWVNFPVLPDSVAFVSQSDALESWNITFPISNRIAVNLKSGGINTLYFYTDYTFNTSTNYHIAVVRVDNSNAATAWRIYINGVGQTLTKTVGDWNAAAVTVAGLLQFGAYASSYYMRGWVDEFRISKGIARWTSDFEVPTGPYGKVYTTTVHYKFPPSGAEFKGYERLAYADSADWYFGTGDFTIDMWVRFNQITDASVLAGQYADANNYWYMKKYTTLSGNCLAYKFVSGSTTIGEGITNTWTVSTAQWYHLAFERTTTTGKIFIDGVSQAFTSGTNFAAGDVGNIAGTLEIGQQNNAEFLDGRLDEIRVSKGIARWSGNFSSPTEKHGTLLKQDFDTFLGYVVGSDPANPPWSWTEGNTTVSSLTTVTGLNGAKFVKKFQNYLFLANVTISGVKYSSRVYWSDIISITSWQDYNYIDIAKNDGDEISGIKELGDRLVVYKRNSIYVIIFTGDADIPFIVQRTNSAVGCVAPFSIQVVENGHVFCAYDGIYYFDGSNAYKMSDKITDTFKGINFNYIENAASFYQQVYNRYLLSLPSGTSIYNNFILGWNGFLNSWTKYTGMSASSMAIFLVKNVEERPYFSDYSGYTYRGDYGANDYPTGTKTAIDSYFYTNWKNYETLCDKKGVPHVYFTIRNESETNLTLKYSYDFYNGDQYTQTFSAVSTQSVTSHTVRRDLTGRGRFVRLGIANNNIDTSFRIDGIGTTVTQEGRV